MSILPNILAFLRTPASGSEALRAKLAEIVEAIPTAEQEVARLAAERSSRLLDADDKALERIEADHASAVRNLDRLVAAKAEIAKRLAQAEADEAKAALDAERAEAEKIAVETAAKVAKRYPALGRELAALVEEVERAEALVAKVNAALIAAGRVNELLPEVEPRAIPEPAHVMPGPYKLAAASLPPAPTLGFLGIGRAREQAEIAGFVASQIG